MNRLEAERYALQRLHDGSDLWANGVELPDVLGVDGLIDPEKIDQAVGGLLGPKAAPRSQGAAGTGGAHRHGRRQAAQTAPSWVDAFGGGKS